MLRVTIELLPGGFERNKELLETVDIINIGPHSDNSKGNYRIIRKNIHYEMVSYVNNWDRNQSAFALASESMKKLMR